MMERYLIQDHNYTIFIIKSNAPVEEIKRAIRYYFNDRGGLEYAQTKAKQSDTYEQLIAKRIIGYLKTNGHMVGEIALGTSQTNEYTQSHFGGTLASTITSIIGSGTDPEEGFMYHNATDKEPITVVSSLSMKENKKNIYHKRMEPKHINEAKRYIREVLNQS